MKLKKYDKGGKNKAKEAYLKKVEADILKKQENSDMKEFAHRMSYGLMAKNNPDKKSAIIRDDLKRKNEVELREALKKASDKFDKNTKYDELLGRATNPDKEYKEGGKMKLKKYGNGGKYPMYQNGGPVKAKKMSKEELERDAAMAKERLEELAGEKAYLSKRKEADRQYRMALKEGATEEQATKVAEKYLRMYLKGGQVKLDANKDGKISGEDFKMLKAKKK